MKKRKFSPGTAVIYAILIFWAFTTIYPILWVVLNSFKVKDKIMVDSFALPLGELFTTANYKWHLTVLELSRLTETAC